MKPVAGPRFSARIDRFLRWFFTASPDDVVLPPPPSAARPRSRIVAHRKPARVHAQHAGPVRVAVKAKR